jgi:hypothetical protein
MTLSLSRSVSVSSGLSFTSLACRASSIVSGFVLLVVSSLGCAGMDRSEAPVQRTPSTPFTIAMIPDTQNYVDYTHQTVEGFAFDASELFLGQMSWIAERSRANGGDIAFLASVGDVWQHQTKPIDPEHEARGIGRVDNPVFAGHFDPTPKTLTIEVPKAIEGYELIAASGMPFGVAPGNHDYDAMWTADSFPPNFDKPRNELTWSVEDLGILHVGGLDNFRSAFGDDKPFFAGKPWYVGSHRGGTSSAQIFEAGGYRFLHLALEMQAGDDVVAWVEGILDANPGLPTIISTHDYLDPRGERAANPIVDLGRVDPEGHNSAEELFAKLIAPNDQIFLVLCGHHHGQAFRVDDNDSGHSVYQMLADYQDRGQAGLDAGQAPDPFMGGLPTGIGDGWFRLLTFDLAGESPIMKVRTYSTHYDARSSGLETYSAWYREHEQPDKSDEEFLASEEFDVPLEDFRERFGSPVP